MGPGILESNLRICKLFTSYRLHLIPEISQTPKAYSKDLLDGQGLLVKNSFSYDYPTHSVKKMMSFLATKSRQCAQDQANRTGHGTHSVTYHFYDSDNSTNSNFLISKVSLFIVLVS